MTLEKLYKKMYKTSTVIPRKFSSRINRNVDALFNEIIVPQENYMLKGDTKPIRSIPMTHIQKIITKCKNSETSINNVLYNSENYLNDHRNSSSKYLAKTKRRIKIPTILNLANIQEKNENFNFRGSMKKLDNTQKSRALLYKTLANKKEDEKNNEESQSVEYLLHLYLAGAVNYEHRISLNAMQKENFKLKDNDPYIYSFNETHPFSMFYKTKYKNLYKTKNALNLPAPRFIDSNEWMKKPDYTFEKLFESYTIDDNKGLIIKDPEIQKKFQGLISNIIGQLLRVPFGHHMSIQVKIFSPNTVPQKYTCAFSYANKFLIPASDPKMNSYERFKHAITFCVSGIYLAVGTLKPFNPFLGETYQGELPNGAKLYTELVTHSPLCCRFLLIYKKVYEVSGYWNLSVKSQKFGTMMTISQKGPIYIKFPQINECIIGHYPEAKMINVVSDDRANLYNGNFVFIDNKNNYKAVIQINPFKKRFHDLVGVSFKYNYPKKWVYNYDKEWEFGKKFKIGQESKNGIDVIDNITGSWINNLDFGEQRMWDMKNDIPEFMRPVKKCIPSDGRFREDLIWLYRSFNADKKEDKKIYLNISQEWKVMMEEFNRWERKRRIEIKNKMNIRK